MRLLCGETEQDRRAVFDDAAGVGQLSCRASAHDGGPDQRAENIAGVDFRLRPSSLGTATVDFDFAPPFVVDEDGHQDCRGDAAGHESLADFIAGSDAVDDNDIAVRETARQAVRHRGIELRKRPRPIVSGNMRDMPCMTLFDLDPVRAQGFVLKESDPAGFQRLAEQGKHRDDHLVGAGRSR